MKVTGEVGEKETVTTAATAVPELLTCCGVLESLSLKLSVAVSAPGAEAVKVMPTVHEDPADPETAKVAPVQLSLVVAKSLPD